MSSFSSISLLSQIKDILDTIDSVYAFSVSGGNSNYLMSDDALMPFSNIVHCIPNTTPFASNTYTIPVSGMGVFSKNIRQEHNRNTGRSQHWIKWRQLHCFVVPTSSGEMLHSGSFISDSRHYTAGDKVAIYGTGSSSYIDMSLSQFSGILIKAN